MAVKKRVVMKLCIRVAGRVTCKDGGYSADYESGTVGPTAVTISYPA